MSSDYQLEDTIYIPFTTRAFATGIPTALVSGVVDIYEDVTATPIVTAETLTVSLNGHAGFNMITVTATAATGFEAGKSYTAILDAGTVDSVSVIGEVVGHFTLDKSAAAKDLANATDGLGAIKAETALIVADTNELQTDDVPGLIATAQADLDIITGTAGVIIDDSAANDTTISDAVWDEDATPHQTQGTFGQAIGDPVLDATTIYQSVATDAAGDNVAVDIAAVQADTDDIQTRIPAALVGGRIDATIDATGFEDAAVDKIWDEDIVAAHGTADTAGLLVRALGALISQRTNNANLNALLGVGDTASNDLPNQILDGDTLAELAQAAPAATPTLAAAMMLLYMALRNGLDTTSTLKSIKNDAGTVITKATLSDDGTTFTKAEFISGA
jgi:hypothetical protein